MQQAQPLDLFVLVAACVLALIGVVQFLWHLLLVPRTIEVKADDYCADGEMPEW